MLILLTIITGFCSLSYELALAQLLSSLLGNTVLRYATTLAVYTLALGVGSILFKRKNNRDEAELFLKAEIAIAILGLLSPLLFISVYKIAADYTSLQSQTSLITVVTHSIIALVGFISGYELPILASLYQRQNKTDNTSRVLAADYAGMFLASLVFPLILFPVFGIFTSVWMTTALNLIAAILTFTLLTKPESAPRPFRKIGIALAASAFILNICALGFTSQISQLLSTWYAQV